MITRKVNRKDASPAGFTFSWVEKLSQNLDKLYLITWQESSKKGLFDNVEMISLSGSKFRKIFSIQKHLLKILPKVDGVFCHQNPEYTILAAPLSKLFRKKVVTWYTHGTVSFRLKLVNLLANKILTASGESCRLKNRKKIKVVGHGINIDRFKKYKEKQGVFKIISVGRISPVKNLDILIKAVDILIKSGIDLRLEIIGVPVLKKDKKYAKKLKELAKGIKEHVYFGKIPYSQIAEYYSDADLFVNLSDTASLDKAVLEAMACQTMVLTSNQAFKDILDKDLIVKKNPKDLAKKIKWAVNLDRRKIGKELRQTVVKNHNLDNLVIKIINQFK